MRALAEKLSLLLQNPDQWIVMSRNARQRFLEKFEFSKNLTRQVQWFEEICLQSDAHLHHYRQL
jgi:glycosyltransferase involved in cell wall biosynthesis